MKALLAVAHVCHRLWKGLLAADRLIRIHFLFFSSLLPLLGGSTVRQDLSPGQIAALLGVGFCFHIYSYVLNDVIDLPVDRTQPLRQGDPLVRGAVRPWQALLVALAPIPLTVPLTVALGGGARAYATLAGGFAMMAVYNLWGKRCPIPPLTDLVQGLAWGSLALYAGQALGQPNVLTWVVAAYGAGFILHINGIHGGLRDLANDLASGALTTAIFLGARPSPDGRTRVPLGIPVFAYSVFAGLAALVLVPLLRNDFGYDPALRITMLVTAGVLCGADLFLLTVVVHPDWPLWNAAFRVQSFLVVATLPIVFVPYVSAGTLLALSLVLALSLLPLNWAIWLWGELRPAAEPRMDRTYVE
ncbi:MAG TPA: UbiA family prenyltransferase [Thermoanaerobaculia bacterium]|jgi:4-hydroxybenzoate polyprenyltransferase